MTLKLCSIEGCLQPLVARGWCHPHYYRWKRWGDPEKTGRVSVCQQCDSEWLYVAKGSRPGPLCPGCRTEFAKCQVCRQVLPHDRFYKDARRPTGIGGRCQACSREYSKTRNAVPYNAAKASRAHLKNRYGITPEQRQQMSDMQGGRCAICGDEAKLDVDHCHSGGHVRGLLCASCNQGLGHFKDDRARLQRAIDYLGEAALERVV
jgi:hypothetical protein